MAVKEESKGTGSEKKKFVHFQIDWVEDLERVLKKRKVFKKKIKEKIQGQVGEKKRENQLVSGFYRTYLYMLKQEVKVVAVYFKDTILICGVDVFGRSLVCIAVPEDGIGEFSTEIVDLIGTKIPDPIEYEEVCREVWKEEFRSVAVTLGLLLVVLVLGVFFREFVWPVLFSQKKKTVKKAPPPRVTFTPEEQREAYKRVFWKCMDDVKEKFLEVSTAEHVRIREVKFGLAESNRKEECTVALVEQYDYPAPETVKAGEYYVRRILLKNSLNREELIKGKWKVGDVPKVGNYEKCVEAVMRLNGDVLSRKGGVVKIRTRSELTPEQAFLLPDFARELTKVCGWEVLKVRRMRLSVGKRRRGGGEVIRFESDVELKDLANERK